MVPHRVLFLADCHDRLQRRALDEAGAETLVCGGSYAAKINTGVDATVESLIFMAADDLLFHPGWLEAARGKLAGSVRVVGTNDLQNRRVLAGTHGTHNLVDRRYVARGTVDGPGLLHDGYTHNFVDDEFVGTAQARGAWAHAADSVVEHLHPNSRKAPRDATYRRGDRSFRQDRRLFEERRHLWT